VERPLPPSRHHVEAGEVPAGGAPVAGHFGVGSHSSSLPDHMEYLRD